MTQIRYLPRSTSSGEPAPGADGDAGVDRDADVVVVGSGAAGLSAALAAAGHGLRVLLITKDGLGGGCTPLAQGGLAAAIGPGDSPELHEQDTITAGAGLCDPDAVAALVSGAPDAIDRLAALGARLDRASLHLEGGHSRHRIVNAGGDAAGAEVFRVLQAAVAASRVEVLTHAVAVDALLADGEPGAPGDGPGSGPGSLEPIAASGRPAGTVAGLAVGVGTGTGALTPGLVTARAVVLATGGFGQAFATTSNPAGVTGDGLALAARAGAELQDVEFVQFHPTMLWQPVTSGGVTGGRRPLVTEALRGAGAVLVDQAGRPVMAGRHPLGDLAPRDVVSAAMQQRMAEGDGPADHLWLDATALGRATLERDFPTVTAACRALGIDPASEPIPVAPGAHYACGGIRADMDGRTSVPGLFAVGEAASTGVHGANRLASNSLTEALIAGRRVGDVLAAHLPGVLAAHLPGRSRPELRLPPAGRGADPASRPGLAAAMSRHAGVLRDRGALEHLLALLGDVPPAPAGSLDLAIVEATSLHTVAVLVTVAALARAESRGSHRWLGVPPSAGGPASHSVLRADGGQVRLTRAGLAAGYRQAGAGAARSADTRVVIGV